MIFNTIRATLRHPQRITSVDFWRGIAILAVVLYHFNGTLPFGSLGVDLFFVISGLLVGGILTRKLINNNPILFFKFFFQRGFKIWPSYFFFILFGSLLAGLIFNAENQSQVISIGELKPYLLFYRNYIGGTAHWAFDHVWSLCVEEHFYILLPLLFIVFYKFKFTKKAVFISIIALILFGIFSKVAMVLFSNSKDTYSATHNRIDGLAWGVLLNLIVSYYPEKIKNLNKPYLYSVLGLLILSITIAISAIFDFYYFEKIAVNSAAPCAFFLILLGSYHNKFKHMLMVKVIGYYSYNWYLWHPIFVIYIQQRIGFGFSALLTYLIVSLIVGAMATHFIEEPLLRIRKKLIS